MKFWNIGDDGATPRNPYIYGCEAAIIRGGPPSNSERTTPYLRIMCGEILKDNTMEHYEYKEDYFGPLPLTISLGIVTSTHEDGGGFASTWFNESSIISRTEHKVHFTCPNQSVFVKENRYGVWPCDLSVSKLIEIEECSEGDLLEQIQHSCDKCNGWFCDKCGSQGCGECCRKCWGTGITYEWVFNDDELPIYHYMQIGNDYFGPMSEHDARRLVSMLHDLALELP